MIRYATELGASPGRGAYAESREAAELMYQCRERINTLIGGESPDHVIFTLNCTDALNLGLRGVLGEREVRSGQHVITTDLEHNSILRPLNELANRGVIEQTRVPCDPLTGLVDPDDIRRAIRPETRMVAMLHGSNVTGTLQAIGEIGRMCRERGLVFLVDAAQSLGHIPVDVRAMNIDLLAFPGHKGLLGPLGTGALYIRPGLERVLSTVREGGTGSVSEHDVQPDFLPDKYEPGSHNAIGIIGLSEGVKWVLDRDVESLYAHERSLMNMVRDRWMSDECPTGLRVYGPTNLDDRCGVYSIRCDGYTPNELADALDESYGILSRPGLHCAPGAHQTIGTFNGGGTVRLSFGPFVTSEDVERMFEAVEGLAEVGTGAKHRGIGLV